MTGSVDLRDDLVLETVEGAEDYLTSDLAGGPVRVTARRPGLLRVRLDGDPAVLLADRLVATVGVDLSPDHGARPPREGAVDHGGDQGVGHDGEASAEPVVAGLDRSLRTGLLGAVVAADRPVRFRVGADDGAVRRTMIAAVTDALGWVNDPSDWDVNLTRLAGSDAGWVAQLGPLAWSARFGKLRRRPWSTTPVVADVLARLLGAQPGQSVHDPCCGTATLLLAAAWRTPDLVLTGTDRDADGLALGRATLTDHGLDPSGLRLAEAVPFAAPDGSLDRVVANLPFGKRVGSHTENLDLYPRLLREVGRTLADRGRAVLLTEDKRLFRDAVSRARGVMIDKERVLRYAGATPTAYVLVRSRRRRGGRG